MNIWLINKTFPITVVFLWAPFSQDYCITSVAIAIYRYYVYDEKAASLRKLTATVYLRITSIFFTSASWFSKFPLDMGRSIYCASNLSSLHNLLGRRVKLGHRENDDPLNDQPSVRPWGTFACIIRGFWIQIQPPRLEKVEQTSNLNGYERSQSIFAMMPAYLII